MLCRGKKKYNLNQLISSNITVLMDLHARRLELFPCWHGSYYVTGGTGHTNENHHVMARPNCYLWGGKQECLSKIILRDVTRSSDVLVSINTNLWFQTFLAFQPKDKRKKMYTKSVKRGKDI